MADKQNVQCTVLIKALRKVDPLLALPCKQESNSEVYDSFGHETHHLVVIKRMDVLVDGVPGQLDLGEAEMDRRRFRDVHDLAVRGQHEDEPVQGLEQVGS